MKTTIKKVPFLALIPLIAFGLVWAPIGSAAAQDSQLACVQPATPAKDLGTLVVGGKIENSSALEWGTQQGCFKKYGLTIKSALVSSTPVGVAGLVSNTYDIIVANPISLIQLMANGDFPARIVAPRYGYTAAELERAKHEPLYPGELLLEAALIVRKDSKIKTWKDFKNTKIGVATIQGAIHAGLLLGFRANHVDPNSVQVLTIPSAQMSAALQRKDVDAIAVSDPTATEAIVAGGRVVGYPGTYFYKPSPAIVYGSTEAIVTKKRAAMKAFQKATLEINKLLNLPENDASFRKVYSKVTGVDDATLAKIKFPPLMEKNVSLAQLHFIPLVLSQLGFTRTKVDISLIVFK